MNRIGLGLLAFAAPLMLIAACASTRTAAPKTAAASPADMAAGDALWEYRCRGCHEPGFPGTPTRAQLTRMGAPVVEAALTRGKMKDLATGLTPQDIRQIAASIAAH